MNFFGLNIYFFLGTEATAATMMHLVECCIASEPSVEFKVDRPFIFVIQETYRGIILFQGKFINK